MLASSTKNRLPAAPTASQRGPAVMTSPRYTGQGNRPGPASPRPGRRAHPEQARDPPSQAASDTSASQFPRIRFANLAHAARDPVPMGRSPAANMT